MAKKKGLKCSKNTFWQAIRNPLYCGKIFIPRYKDEQSCFVKGQHNGIITEELFQSVQKVLDGRGREYRTKIQTNSKFSMRGFLICPRCGRNLTASTSKGRNKHYDYYHCTKGCPYRISTENLMAAFQLEFKKYVPRKEILGVFREVLLESYYDLTDDHQLLKSQKSAQLKDYQERMEHIRSLLASDKIDALDYQKFKSKYEGSICQLGRDLETLKKRVPEIDGLIAQNASYLLQLDGIFQEGNSEDIRSMVNLIFPKKLMFIGTALKAEEINEAVKYIFHYNPIYSG